MSRGTAADSSAEPPASNTRATNLLNAMVVDVSYLVVVSSVATCASDAGNPSTILTPTVTSVRPGDENLRTCSPRGGDLDLTVDWSQGRLQIRGDAFVCIKGALHF